MNCGIFRHCRQCTASSQWCNRSADLHCCASDLSLCVENCWVHLVAYIQQHFNYCFPYILLQCCISCSLWLVCFFCKKLKHGYLSIFQACRLVSLPLISLGKQQCEVFHLNIAQLEIAENFNHKRKMFSELLVLQVVSMYGTSLSQLNVCAASV